MKRDGRTLDHATLETIRLMAVERVLEGEVASAVITSYGFNRTTIWKWLTAAAKPGVGLRALQARPAGGPPPDTEAGTASVPLDQRQGPAPIRTGLRPVDTISGGGPDRAKVRHQIWRYGGWGAARQAQPDTAEPAATGISA